MAQVSFQKHDEILTRATYSKLHENKMQFLVNYTLNEIIK